MAVPITVPVGPETLGRILNVIGEPIDEQRCALFDRLAKLTQAPDASRTELLRLCQTDERLRVPETVRNAVRDREEPLEGAS